MGLIEHPGGPWACGRLEGPGGSNVAQDTDPC